MTARAHKIGMRWARVRVGGVVLVALLLGALITWVVATSGSRVHATSRDPLSSQLEQARAVTARYPTVAAAEAVGYKRVGYFSPGAGAHYVDEGDKSGPGAVDVPRPTAYVYDGVSPTSRVVGLMYYSESPTAPDGFTGRDDHWHRHGSVCSKRSNGEVDILLPGDADLTRAQCDAVNGRFHERSGWMLHAWVVPGWETPDGVFSHAHPQLHCGDGTDAVDGLGYCAGT